MKNSSIFATNFIDNLPKFDVAQKVTHVWNRGIFESLEIPTLHSEIRCPMCGGSHGYRVNDGNKKDFCGWSCHQQQCIAIAVKVSACVYQKPTLANCGVPESLIDSSWEDIQQPKESIENLKKFCQSFSGFLLFAGNSGTGKSCASVCCMKKYLETRNDCQFVNVADLFVNWLALKQNSQSELGLLEKYAQCELLILDDVGNRAPSEAFLDFLYLLINKRNGKSTFGTIISTNLGYQHLAQKLGDAILSRISSGLIVKFTGKDRRISKF